MTLTDEQIEEIKALADIPLLISALEAEKKRADDAEALVERLKREAVQHAQEARTANATIAEIYQAVTGGTGEPGNWHGAEPIKAELARLRSEIEQYRDEVAPIIAAYEAGIDREKPTHRHKESGTEYMLIGYDNQPWHLPAARGTGPSANMREVAIYRSVDDGSEWVLPREEFHERFDEIATRVSANDYPALKENSHEQG